jgi:hypothetical protein
LDRVAHHLVDVLRAEEVPHTSFGIGVVGIGFLEHDRASSIVAVVARVSALAEFAQRIFYVLAEHALQRLSVSALGRQRHPARQHRLADDRIGLQWAESLSARLSEIVEFRVLGHVRWIVRILAQVAPLPFTDYCGRLPRIQTNPQNSNAARP